MNTSEREQKGTPLDYAAPPSKPRVRRAARIVLAFAILANAMLAMMLLVDRFGELIYHTGRRAPVTHDSLVHFSVWTGNLSSLCAMLLLPFAVIVWMRNRRGSIEIASMVLLGIWLATSIVAELSQN